MIQLLLSLFLSLVMVSSAVADSFRQITLKHRDGEALVSRLSPLTSDSVAMVAEGQNLILRGPDAEIKQLAAIIKNLDRPLRQLQVSIFRGTNPHAADGSHADQRWTTQTGSQNRTDTLVITEDTPLLVTENQLVSIVSENYLVAGKRAANADLPELDYRERYQTREYLERTWGILLVPSLVTNDEVSVRARVSAPNDYNPASDKEIQLSILETDITRTMPMATWVLLSGNQSQSEPPVLMSNRRIYSTEKQGDFDKSIWVKIESAK